MKNLSLWLKEIPEGERCKAVPIMTHPGIELCGKTVKEAVTKGEIHAEAIIALNEKFPPSASNTIMDLTVEAEAFGAETEFPENELPDIVSPLVGDLSSIKALNIPSLHQGRIPQYLKAFQRTACAIQDKPVLAGCIGPFSLAARLYGISEIMMALFTDQDMVKLLLEKCTLFLMEYCKAIKATGVNGIIMAEPVAGLISNNDCMEYSTAFIRPIVNEIQDEQFIFVLHNCGNKGHATQAMINTGANALHFGNKTDLTEVLKNVPEKLFIMGNLDPVGLFQQGSEEQVYTATQKLLSDTARFPNFILSTGCDVPPHIPFSNIQAFYDAWKNFSKKEGTATSPLSEQK